MKKKILIVAAHPDDEILGCGGTVARLIKEGHEAVTLILGEGPASRYYKQGNRKEGKDLKDLEKSVHKANETIGIKKVFVCYFSDNSFDTVPLLDIVKTIEKVKKEVKPRIVFTHYRNDLNIDHKITFNAVLTACRPVKGETVKEIYSFEIPSSTEWNYPYTFSPNVFMDVTKTIRQKINAMKCYAAELRKFPHPRSPEALEVYAKRWGATGSVNFAEAFEAVRIIT